MNQHENVLDWISQQEKTLLERVKKWVAINTFSTHVKGLSQLLSTLEEDFRHLDGEIIHVPLLPNKIFTSEGIIVEQPLGNALHIRKRANAPIQILFGGHYDTVFPPESSFQSLREIQPGVWNGPGATDMKGGLAILLTALEAFEQSPLSQKIGWEILLTPDEELGSPGSAKLYRSAAKRNQIGIIFEPSFPDGALVSERKGSANYSIFFKGKAAHVGRDFDQGRSAVFALARLIHQLEKLKFEKGWNINVADIEGKGPVNIVPPLASCKINIRGSTPEIFTEFSSFLKKIAFDNEQEGIQIEIFEDVSRPPKAFDLKTQYLFEAWGSCAKELDLPFNYRPSGGVTDGNLLAEEGLPTLDTAGAIGGNLHTHEEYLLEKSLVERAKITALFLLRLAAGEIKI